MARTARFVVVVAVLVVVATGGAVAASNVLLARQRVSESRDPVLDAQQVVQVRQMDLATKTSIGGRLTYAPEPNSTASALGGIVTALPTVGAVIGRGQVLYELDRQPVVLLYGDVPEWRSLELGAQPGTDVAELEDNLNALGYGGGFPLPTDGRYTPSVVWAVGRLLKDRGIGRPTDRIDLGRFVFFPGPVRVEDIAAPPGSLVSSRSQVLTLTTTTRLVEVQVPSSLGVNVMAGQTATVDAGGANGLLRGVVATVHALPSSGSGSSQGTASDSGGQLATITLVDEHPDLPPGEVPAAVTITTQVTRGAMVVPITAVVALVEGGYALNADDGHGHYHLVPVTVGAYDDVDGLVQVAGSAVHPGLKVLAPR